MTALIKISKYGFVLASILMTASLASFPQTRISTIGPEPKIVTTPPKVVLHHLFGGSTSERSLKVNKNVNVSLCVNQGNVKVNGWSRNELRVFVEDGSKFGFKVVEKDTRTSEPVWVMVTQIIPKDGASGGGECIWGGNIEIDLPQNATIDIKGKGMTLDVDTVRKANVKSVGGDISLRNVSDGITAYAGQGGISVISSNGRIDLDSTTGNIVVFEAGPSEIGDVLRAKTQQGSVTLQKVGHRQLEVGSISGEIVYDGALRTGGFYNFSTNKGSIRLALPEATSCKIDVSFGYGNFNSELKFVPETENISPGPLKRLRGKLGSGGETTLILATTTGRISLITQ